MDKPNDLQPILDDLRETIPPPSRAAEHRAALLRRAETVTTNADARPLDWSAPALSTNGFGRYKRMRKRTIIALAAALMLVSTALAQQIIQFFTPDDDDQSETTLYYEPTFDFTGREEEFILPPLDELLPTLPFTPRLPSNGDNLYEIKMVRFDAERSALYVLYTCKGTFSWGFELSQQPISDAELAALPPLNVGASAVIETVQIGEASGQFVWGRWHLPDLHYTTRNAEIRTSMIWENNEETFMLRWYDEGMLYTLGSESAGEFNPYIADCWLNQEAAISVAESLVPHNP